MGRPAVRSAPRSAPSQFTSVPNTSTRPKLPRLPDAVRDIIALRDQVPEPPDVPVASINRPRLLDAYFGVNLDNWEILVGRQSLSWGPGPGGSLIWSDNIEPVDMVRIVNSEAERLPGFFKYLGPARLDQFFGRLSGHDFIPRPVHLRK